MPLVQLNRLVSLIHDNNFSRTNRIIFTYNTNGQDPNQKIYHKIVNTLDCTSIYCRSIEERKSELAMIIPLFLNQINIQCNTSILGFEPDALKEMIDFNWPGNFSQLSSIIKKLALESSSYYITQQQVVAALELERKAMQTNSYYKKTEQLIAEHKSLFEYTQDIVREVLEHNHGNQTKTAKQLGISRTTLWRYLKSK